MSPLSPDRGFVDLHVHTTWSDGRWSPRQVVVEAAERGLTVVAVTDHDVTGGIAEAQDAGAARGIDVLAGIELTADWDGRTVHVLGYGIDPARRALVAAVERGRAQMAAHVDSVLTALAEAGVPLSHDDLAGYRVRYASGAALVLAMVQKGLLRKAANGAALLRMASREPRAYSAAEAVALIHAAGGVAALAHPVKIRKDRPNLSADDLAPLVAAGLDAVEVWQIVHGSAERDHYGRLAADLGLLAVGGSDCHGPRREYGPRLGSQNVPFATYERLLDAITARRQGAGRTGA